MNVKNTITPEFISLLKKIKKSGLMDEVIASSLLIMKANPLGSPLLCLQIAASDWDV
jgi:hypothetical protein|tara:strand:+ start:99 stop:269 length:171 start_codon:yes stop_codon:yes gene_type:complete